MNEHFVVSSWWRAYPRVAPLLSFDEIAMCRARRIDQRRSQDFGDEEGFWQEATQASAIEDQLTLYRPFCSSSRHRQTTTMEQYLILVTVYWSPPGA
jgi:hypothetical protein